MTILRRIDLLWVRSKYINTALLEAKCDVLRELACTIFRKYVLEKSVIKVTLTTNADDNTASLLEFVDIHDTFPAQFLEVQPVRFVEVS